MGASCAAGTCTYCWAALLLAPLQHARAASVPTAGCASVVLHCPPSPADLVVRVVHAMWRRLERTTAAAAAAGSSSRPGSVASGAQVGCSDGCCCARPLPSTCAASVCSTHPSSTNHPAQPRSAPRPAPGLPGRRASGRRWPASPRRWPSSQSTTASRQGITCGFKLFCGCCRLTCFLLFSCFSQRSTASRQALCWLCPAAMHGKAGCPALLPGMAPLLRRPASAVPAVTLFDCQHTLPAAAHACAPVRMISQTHRPQDPQLLLELYEAMGQQEAAAELHLQAALEMAAGEAACVAWLVGWFVWLCAVHTGVCGNQRSTSAACNPR